MPIHISNLAFYDSSAKKGVRLGYILNDKKNKIRVNRKTGKEV